MKYKVGDEVLVKARIVEDSVFGYILEAHNNILFTAKKDKVIPVPDMNAEEAWDISKKLFSDYSNSELDEIFGKGWSYPKLMEMTPQQAKAKIESWEAEKINVGDVVIIFDEYGIVTRVDAETGFFNVLKESGCTGSYKKIEIKKTGRHIDIGGVLKQIGEADA